MIIAHLAPLVSTGRAIVMLAAATLFLWAPFAEPDQPFLPMWVFVFAWPLAFWLLLEAGLIFGRLLFRNGAALWVGDGELRYLSRWRFRIAVADIASADAIIGREPVAGSGGWVTMKVPYLSLRLKDGRHRGLSLRGIKEPAEEVAASLRNLLVGSAGVEARSRRADLFEGPCGRDLQAGSGE